MRMLEHRGRSPEPVRDWPFTMFPSLRWVDEFFPDGDRRQLLNVEEFTDDGTLVVRAELPGIDPDKDVEISVADGMLHITAERAEHDEKSERNFRRREFRYGSFARSVALPDGCDDADVTASYRDGLLEVRVPLPAGEPKTTARRIPVSQS